MQSTDATDEPRTCESPAGIRETAVEAIAWEAADAAIHGIETNR